MIEFEPFESEDIPRLLSWIGSQAELVQWTGQYFDYPLTAEQLQEHLQRSRGESPSGVILRVRLRNSGEIIGHVELDGIEYRNGFARVCRVLVGPKHLRGSGLGTLIMEKLLRFAFEEMNLNQLGLNVVIFNQAAISVYKKLGFEIARVNERSLRIGEKFWTSYYMTLDRASYEKRRTLGK